jgi:DNA replication protein DnaC
MPPEQARRFPHAVADDAGESVRASAEGARLITSPDPCGRCFGTGQEVVPGRGARRCKCRRAEDRRRLVEAARIPRRYQRCTLEQFRPAPGNGSHLRAYGYAYELAKSYPTPERGLLLVGPVGVGKTHLTIGVLHALLARGVRCLFYEFGALLKELQDSYNPVSQTSELRVLEPVFDAEVLLLDELGALKPTDWARDTMMQIIGARYNDSKLTLFTSNYFDARRHPAEETLEDRIGVRLRSRLYEMCRTVVIEGEDYRRRFDVGHTKEG